MCVCVYGTHKSRQTNSLCDVGHGLGQTTNDHVGRCQQTVRRRHLPCIRSLNLVPVVRNLATKNTTELFNQSPNQSNNQIYIVPCKVKGKKGKGKGSHSQHCFLTDL